MKLACLYSGGKDSTFSILRSSEVGHDVVCLITLHPSADDSMLFHYPNSWITRYTAQALCKPLIEIQLTGMSSKENEYKALKRAIEQAKSLYNIEGVLHGGISSRFQNNVFEEVCLENQLKVVAPLWNIEASHYLHLLVNSNFDVRIVSVSAMGLDESWLGKSLDHTSIMRLEELSKKYGFNLTFEGGEAETLVTDCPLFKKKINIKRANTHWDGQRGRFEIIEASIIPKHKEHAR